MKLHTDGSIQNEVLALAQRFSEKPAKALLKDEPVWIFGAGQFGRDLCVALKDAGYSVAGFVETSPSTHQVLGLPLVNWQQWSPTHHAAPLCIGIFNRGMPLDELEKLARQNGATDVFLPWDVYHLFKQNLGWRFWLSEPQRILSQLDALAKAMACLSDEISQRCLLDIAAFRLGFNTSYGSFHHTENQYFNPLTLAALQNQPICFVDGGAYNGDTYLELCGLAEVQDAYLFEPDPSNFEQLVSNTRHIGHRAQCIPLGLSNSYNILSFNAGNGEGASITENGTSHIAVAPLDAVLGCYEVDFIKLDVEGAELSALQGAHELIHRSRPVLALSLYHRPEDLWELPLALSAMCKDYNFYIRQHFANTFDSVLYAVPAAR
jgi:FkbM family methyltransferase